MKKPLNREPPSGKKALSRNGSILGYFVAKSPSPNPSLKESALKVAQQCESSVSIDQSEVSSTQQIHKHQVHGNCPVCGKSCSLEKLQLHVNHCLDVSTEKPGTSVIAENLSAERPTVKMDTDRETHTENSDTGTPPGKPAIVNNLDLEDEPEILEITQPLDKSYKARNVTVPFYKILSFSCQKVAVDGFKYDKIPGVCAYFLTHFHSDHYGGLTRKWSAGPIFCTPATARLCELHLGIHRSWLRPVALHEPFYLEGGHVRVVFEDANHCPGAAIILFQEGSRAVLHTGDFRASQFHVDWLKDHLNANQLDTLYLDTTYLNPRYAFPSQDSVVESCGLYCEQMQKGRLEDPVEVGALQSLYSYFRSSTLKPESKTCNPLVLVGSYTIGKEKMALHVAAKLGTKIYASSSKLRTLRAIGDPTVSSLLSSDPRCGVHLVKMQDLRRGDKLSSIWTSFRSHFTNLVAIIPSGWNFRSTQDSTELQTFTLDHVFKSRKIDRNGLFHILQVPYSEHSSYRELELFCTSVRPKKVIPTVKLRELINGCLDKWSDSQSHPEQEALLTSHSPPLPQPVDNNQ